MDDLDRDAIIYPAAARWASLARTHLETGMMYAVKAITRPTGGLGQKPNRLPGNPPR